VHQYGRRRCGRGREEWLTAADWLREKPEKHGQAFGARWRR
jgi:hypothetical protein